METLHYLLLADHLTFQKLLMTRIRDTGLTPGQPKVLDYLRCHDGAVQKDIAAACRIEPATITSVLLTEFEAIEAQAYDDFTPTEQTQLRALLSRVQDNMTRMKADPNG